MKLILSLTTIPVIWLAASVVQAQTTAPAPTVSPVDLGNSSGQIQQSEGFSNSNSSSRQFFQQGRDKLYFLEESDPVLQIDEEISEETEDSELEIEESRVEQTQQEQSE